MVKNTARKRTIEPEEKPELDEEDEKVIAELGKDCRRSTRELARALGMHPSSVSSRIEKLKAAGIIKGFTAELDFQKLGYDYIGVIEITMSHGAILEVQQRIARMKNVIAVFDVTGEADSIVIAMAKSRQQFSTLVKSILGMKEVLRTNTHICLNVVKMGMIYNS